jgi:hypothetical protein
MPKPKQHQDRANRNRALLDSISATGPPDWMATVAFYVAVHLVEKLRAYSGEHSTNHDERAAAVRKQFRAIQVPYHQLYEVSRLARYGTTGQFKMTVQQVKSLLIDTQLVAIEKFVAAETTKHTKGASSPEAPAQQTDPQMG